MSRRRHVRLQSEIWVELTKDLRSLLTYGWRRTSDIDDDVSQVCTCHRIKVEKIWSVAEKHNIKLTDGQNNDFAWRAKNEINEMIKSFISQLFLYLFLRKVVLGPAHPVNGWIDFYNLHVEQQHTFDRGSVSVG
jgi:hypothetical protein